MSSVSQRENYVMKKDQDCVQMTRDFIPDSILNGIEKSG